MNKPYTVLLLRPDYMTDYYGTDTYLAHVDAPDPQSAVDIAKDEQDEPEDYVCLFCTDGHCIDYGG